MPPTEPTTAPTMTGTFEASPCGPGTSEVPLGVSLVVVVWVGFDMVGVELRGPDEATEPGAAVMPLGSSTYTVRASAGRPICSGQPINETDGKTEGDAWKIVIVAHERSLAARLARRSGSICLDDLGAGALRLTTRN